MSSRPPGVADEAAGEPTEAEGARRAAEPELRREGDRPLGVAGAVFVAAVDDDLGGRHLGERDDELGAGRQRLEERDRLCRERGRTRIAEPEEHLGERGHRRGGGGEVAACPERARSPPRSACPRLGGSPGLLRGLGEAGERLGPLGMPGRGERERPLEADERDGRVQAERPLAGEDEEPQRRRFQLRRLLRSARRRG